MNSIQFDILKVISIRLLLYLFNETFDWYRTGKHMFAILTLFVTRSPIVSSHVVCLARGPSHFDTEIYRNDSDFRTH